MNDNKIMCWWHPKREAKWIVNLGTKSDLDTPACDKCKKSVVEMQKQEFWRNAIVRPI